MRIGIVNDIAMAAEILRRAVELAPEHHVCWIARDGFEAVAHCARDAPDLVLMDMVMPGMDGVEATRRIMEHSPCAILIVTVSVEANMPRVFEAMGHGALDAIDTPALGTELLASGAQPLLAKIQAIGKLLGKDSRTVRRSDAPTSRSRLIAIGASAGGPAALATLLQALPQRFQVPIVIVQHVDNRFVPGLLDWLGGHSRLPIRLAKEGSILEPGVIHLAGGNEHLSLIAADRLGYTPNPTDAIYRPSIDVFFNSVADLWTGQAIGVLLTGMGRDGATGLKALREKGHHTIAQDEATSAVYGMPKAAAQIGAAVEILPLERLVPHLIERSAER